VRSAMAWKLPWVSRAGPVRLSEILLLGRLGLLDAQPLIQLFEQFMQVLR